MRRTPPQEKPITGAIYGGLPRGDAEIHAMVESAMAALLDAQQDVPAE